MIESLNALWAEWGTVYLIGIPIWFTSGIIIFMIGTVIREIKLNKIALPSLRREVEASLPREELKIWRLAFASVVWPISAAMLIIVLSVALVFLTLALIIDLVRK